AEDWITSFMAYAAGGQAQQNAFAPPLGTSLRLGVPSFRHTEPKRGAKWWGMSALVTFALFESDPL
ncbi:hypothetical protein BK655_07205, partial [Pseudomonas brassicacearum]